MGQGPTDITLEHWSTIVTKALKEKRKAPFMPTNIMKVRYSKLKVVQRKETNLESGTIVSDEAN